MEEHFFDEYNLDMLSNPNYTSTSQMDYSAEQLRMPLNIPYGVDKDDPMWTFLDVIKEVDLKKYLRSHRGNQGHDDAMMFRVVLFAFMNQVYTLRDMEEKCCTDTRFIYLSNEEKPSHMAFQRFISNKLKDDLSDIFTEINEIIKEKDNVNTRVLYIDGSNWEANATKFSFVWRATAEKSLKRSKAEAARTVKEIEGLVNLKYTYSDKSAANLERYLVKLQAFMTDIMKVRLVYGTGKRKTPIQRHFDSLMSDIQKIEECEEKLRICGDDRNSYSKTDHDATFMHMKYDYYMHTGVFKPGYNVQCGICDEYIWHVRVGSERADSATFPSFMDGYRRRYGGYPGIVTADAGYGSERNYMYCLSHGIDAYIKYMNYRSEKTAAFKKQQYCRENLLHIEDGKYFCPAHKEFRYVRDIEREKNGFLSITQEYECENCESCPFKKECTKAKGNRMIGINVILDDMKAAAKKRLDSEAGIQLRQQRSIQAEGTFGVLKQDRDYARVYRRGKKNVENEVYLVAIGYNLMKYYNKQNRKKMS